MQIIIDDYKCHIDTDDAPPKIAKNIRFDMHETPMVQATTDKLLQKKQTGPDKDSKWLSCPVLEPKSHQESVSSGAVDDFE